MTKKEVEDIKTPLLNFCQNMNQNSVIKKNASKMNSRVATVMDTQNMESSGADMEALRQSISADLTYTSSTVFSILYSYPLLYPDIQGIMDGYEDANKSLVNNLVSSGLYDDDVKTALQNYHEKVYSLFKNCMETYDSDVIMNSDELMSRISKVHFCDS